VIRDLAVMLADGGCLADLRALGDQQAPFGAVASSSTAFGLIGRIASDPAGLERPRAAHTRARARAWELAGAPTELDIDLDATLLTAHSDKEGAAGNFKGFRLSSDAGLWRSDRRGAVARGLGVRQPRAAGLVPRRCYPLLGRQDLTETVREAIVQIPDRAWVSAVDQDGDQRPNGHVAEITADLDLGGWPAGSRVIVRRERAHPGAQLSFTDHDGHRFQSILTDQPSEDIAAIERRHRARARVEDHIRNHKETVRNLLFRDFEHNRIWLELVLVAHDLLAWTQRLLLTGELARCEPKRLRYRLLHVAARLAFHARGARLRLSAPGPGPKTSPPRLRASKHSPRQPDVSRHAHRDDHPEPG
jgi:hypothetical protein